MKLDSRPAFCVCSLLAPASPSRKIERRKYSHHGLLQKLIFVQSQQDLA